MENLKEFFKVSYEAAKLLRAVNNKTRKKILEALLTESSDVTALYVKFRLEQSQMSQHLAILRDAGLVVIIKDGKKRFYSVNKEQAEKILPLSRDLAALKKINK